MNYIVIALCTQGHVDYVIDTYQVRVNSGEMLVVSERHVVEKCNTSEDFDGLAFITSVDFFQDAICGVSDLATVFLVSKSHPVIALSEDEAGIFNRYFYAIRNRINDTSNHFRKALVKTLLLALFYDMSNVMYRFQQTTASHLKRNDIVFTQFIKLVEANFRRERRVKWYAKEMGVSSKYLSEAVRLSSRRTPNEWINIYVVMELRLKLKTTEKSIGEITKEMNFANQSFLGRYFKDHVGMSPSEYRNMH